MRILFAFALLVSQALAIDYYISAFGSDSNGGKSSNDAFLTIAHGISVAVDGDVINIEQGSYAEALSITDKSITLKGESSTASATQVSKPCTITQSTKSASNAVPMNVSLINMAFVNAGPNAAAVVADAANVVFKNVQTANAGTGIRIPWTKWHATNTRTITIQDSQLEGDSAKSTTGIEAINAGGSSFSNPGFTVVNVQNSLLFNHKRAIDSGSYPAQYSYYYFGDMALNIDSSQLYDNIVGVINKGYDLEFKTTATTFKRNSRSGFFVPTKGTGLTTYNAQTTTFDGGDYGIEVPEESVSTFKMVGSDVTISNAAVCGFELGRKGTVALKQAAFKSNGGAATYKGGALNVTEQTVALTLQGVAFTGNTAAYGGALALSASTTLNARLSSFASNTAANGGGAIWCDNAQAHIGDTKFDQNKAPVGGSGECTTACVMYASKNTFSKNGPGGPQCSGFAG